MNDTFSESTTVITDSRSLTSAARTTFVALITPSGDGHDFVRDLFNKGVKRFVVSRDIEGEKEMEAAGARFIHTSDTMEYLQRLGAEARDRLKGHLTAVTGSRGKTIVKEWLAALLGAESTRSPRSFNSQIGVPLSLISADKNALHGVMEAGVSEVGDMARLEEILRPDTVVVTNITDEHDGGFPDRQAKINEKLGLALHASTIVYCIDDPRMAQAVAALKSSANQGLREMVWSAKGYKADVTLHSTERTEHQLKLDISIGADDRRTVCTEAISSDADVKNLVTTLAAFYALKGDAIHSIPWETMAAKLTHIDNRLTVLEGVNNCKVIADRFTADAISLRPALDFARRTARTGQPLTVILNCDQGGYNDMSLTIALLEEYGVRRLIITGSPAIALPCVRELKVERFDTFTTLLAALGTMRFTDETIYVNSSGLHPDTVSQLLGKLEARQHETVLEVNLDAIVRNYNYFRSKLRPTTGIICMLKADGYGAGATEIAHTLELQGAEAVAVAVADEGQQLREHGVKCRIMVLNPRGHDLDGMIRMQLEPVVYELRFLDEIAAAAAASRRRAVVHIKLETGMRRLGFTAEMLPALMSRLRELPAELVEVKSVFSHLATADCIGMDDYTMQQIDTFTVMCDTLEAGMPERPFSRHILNTAGILRFPQAQMDSCRLGIGLYGIPTLPPEIESGLTPVSALYTTVISVKRWPAGTTVGYGRHGVLQRDSVIATLPIGYADGIDRHFGNGAASMMVRGTMCPTVGNICMDLCMIDVTDCPGCIPGDRVEIFGPNVPVEKLSDTLGTIPYEILTSVSRRVKRVYFRE